MSLSVWYYNITQADCKRLQGVIRTARPPMSAGHISTESPLQGPQHHQGQWPLPPLLSVKECKGVRNASPPGSKVASPLLPINQWNHLHPLANISSNTPAPYHVARTPAPHKFLCLDCFILLLCALFQSFVYMYIFTLKRQLTLAMEN